MSVNSFKPHILILPEDDANRQIFIGFLGNSRINSNNFQILPIANGWKKAMGQLLNNEIPKMRNFSKRRIILLIDFDRHEERFFLIMEQVPEEFKDRIFVIGVKSDPESLRRSTNKSFEKIGEKLAQDCVDNINDLWNHDLLKHNETELERMRKSIRPFLFS